MPPLPTLNEDLYHLIANQYDRSTESQELQQLSVVCCAFRVAIAPLLFEKVRYNIEEQGVSNGHGGPFRRFLKRHGIHIR